MKNSYKAEYKQLEVRKEELDDDADRLAKILFEQILKYGKK